MEREIMTLEKTEGMIDFLNGAVMGFRLDAVKAGKAWHNVLKKYYRDEVWKALEYFIDNTDHKPTHRSIKAFCDRKRKQKRQSELSADGARQIRIATESFANVPGNGRAEQIIFIRSERAAEKWRMGIHDDYWAGLLNRGKSCGFEHAGIDYDSLPAVDTGGMLSELTDSMSLPLTR